MIYLQNCGPTHFSHGSMNCISLENLAVICQEEKVLSPIHWPKKENSITNLDIKFSVQTTKNMENSEHKTKSHGLYNYVLHKRNTAIRLALGKVIKRTYKIEAK